MPTRHKYFMVATIPGSITWDTWNKRALQLGKSTFYIKNNRCYLVNADYVCKDALLKREPRIFKCYSVEIAKRRFWIDPMYKILIPKNWARVQEDEKTYLKRLEKL